MSQLNDSESIVTNFHPIGMLDRDQRTILSIPKFCKLTTTKSCDCKMCDNYCKNIKSLNEWSTCSKKFNNIVCNGSTKVLYQKCHNNGDSGHSDNCNCVKKMSSSIRPSLVKKTNENLLLFCIWLLVILYLPHITAKPFEHHSPSPSSNLQYILTHPCGLMEASASDMSVEHFTDVDLKKMLGVIALQTSTALIEAEVSVKKYLAITWDRTDVEEFNDLWQHREQKWLYPEGKSLDELFYDGDTVDLKGVDMGKSAVYANITKLLLDSDNRFQRLIIGFEQIISQHKDLKLRRLTDNRVIDIFSASLQGLRMVLCEIRTLITSMGLPHSIVSVNVMSDEDRSDDLLDWIIFREYIKQLKFLKSSLKNLTYNKIYMHSNLL